MSPTRVSQFCSVRTSDPWSPTLNTRPNGEAAVVPARAGVIPAGGTMTRPITSMAGTTVARAKHVEIGHSTSGGV